MSTGDKTIHLCLSPLWFCVMSAILFVLCHASDLSAQSPPALVPGKLAIYYGYPSSVNGANGNIQTAVDVFSAYDAVIFGDTLQLPQYDANDPNRNNPNYDKACTQNSHYDHDNTVQIIQGLNQQGTDVYGYISIGGENTARICPTISPLPKPLTLAEIQDFVDRWKAMGVTGVFYDEAGYDFGTDRARQNAAVDYAHSQGLRVFINAFQQEEIFESTVVGTITYVGNLSGQTSTLPMNPGGTAPHLGPNDLSLLESFQIIQGNYRDPIEWADRSDKVMLYRRQYGTQFATVTTAVDADPECGFDQAKFDYAWWSSFLYGFDLMGWGEGFNFSAAGNCNGQLPLRVRPAPTGIGDAFTSPAVAHVLNIHSRQTSTGRIEVNVINHSGQFIAGASTPPSGQPAPLIGELRHWWPGDGNAQDIAGFSHGALTVGKSWFAPGQVGQAFSFDGRDDFVAFGRDAAVTGNGPFSVDAWIRTMDDRGVILQQRGSGYDGQYVLSIGGLWITDPGKVCWATYGNGLFGFDFCSGVAVNDGAWHHVAGVREADGAGRIYIDGVLNNSQAAPPRTLAPLEVYLGADKRDDAAFFSGLIDEVVITNRALTLDEVHAISAAGSGGRKHPSTHGVWVFSDEISTLAARGTLIQRSASSGLTDLYVSVYRSTPNSAGRWMYHDADMADLIAKAHLQGIHVWAAYGAPDWAALGCAATGFPMQRMAEVVAYNVANPTARFDGVILDVEPTEPQTASDYRNLLGLYACTLDALKPSGMGLQTALRFFWDGAVEFPSGSSVTQRVYEHILDMDQTKYVVMGYRDFAGPADCTQDGIVCLDRDEVTYATSQGRLSAVVAGLETQDCAPGCGSEKVTFFEEGVAELNRQAGCVVDAFATQTGFGGFAVHRYGDTYLSGQPLWSAENPGFPGQCNPPTDSTPPLITPGINGNLGTNGWYVSDVTVDWSVVDNESPITSQVGCDQTVIIADTSGMTLLCTATSGGGSTTESVMIKRDATAPTVSGLVSPPANGAGWHNSDATVSFACSDATSGMAACGPNQTLSGEGAGQTVSGTGTDNAGNAAVATVSNINIDRMPPVIVGSVAPAPNPAGWHNDDATVSFTCTDDGSGVASCGPNAIVTSEGRDQSVAGAATDMAGNGATTSLTMSIDKTPPTATAIVAPAANAAGWHNSDVTVNFSGSDELSGLAECCAPLLLSDEGAGQSAAGTCSDVAGNVSDTATAGAIAIDKTAPETVLVLQPPALSETGEAAFAFTGSDGGSGVAGFECGLDGGGYADCSSGAASYTLLGSGPHTFAVRSVDLAGNADITPAHYEWTTTLPAPGIQAQVLGVSGNNGWYRGDVTVGWQIDGQGLVIDSSTGCEAQTVVSDTAGVTFTCSATSQGGTSTASVTVKRDATAPTITGSAAPAPNEAGWNNGDVSVSFTCVDVLAGVASCGPDQTVTGEGTNQAVTGAASDAAGNSATATVAAINIDQTAPVASADITPMPNSAGWHNSDVMVSFSGSDALSGIAGCTAPVVITANGAGQVVSGVCTDAAGNLSAPAKSSPINLDKDAPVVNVTGVVDGATYVVSGVPSAGCSTQDGLSGVATQALLTVTGGNGHGEGAFVATCSGASDWAGNPGAASVSYRVGYSFSGFFQPVDNPPVINSVKAGQAIPVKFSLGANLGLDIFAAGFPASQQVVCTTGAPSSSLVEIGSAGNSTLQYDPVRRQYVYVWKSEKAWSGQCRQLVVRLKDGTDHVANFKFK